MKGWSVIISQFIFLLHVPLCLVSYQQLKKSPSFTKRERTVIFDPSSISVWPQLGRYRQSRLFSVHDSVDPSGMTKSPLFLCPARTHTRTRPNSRAVNPHPSLQVTHSTSTVTKTQRPMVRNFKNKQRAEWDRSKRVSCIQKFLRLMCRSDGVEVNTRASSASITAHSNLHTAATGLM